MNTHGLEPEQIQSLNTLLIIFAVPICDKWLYPRMRRSAISWLQPHPLRRMPLGMLVAASAFYWSFFVQVCVWLAGWGLASWGLAGWVAHCWLRVCVWQLVVDASDPGAVSVILQVPGYILITIAEVLVSITGIEFAYSEAPLSMKGSIMAFFYMTVAIGDLLTGTWQPGCNAFPGLYRPRCLPLWCPVLPAGFLFNMLGSLPIRWIIFVFASLMVGAFVAFVFVARRYKRPVRAQRPGVEGGDAADGGSVGTGVSLAATAGDSTTGSATGSNVARATKVSSSTMIATSATTAALAPPAGASNPAHSPTRTLLATHNGVAAGDGAVIGGGSGGDGGSAANVDGDSGASPVATTGSIDSGDHGDDPYGAP